MIFDKFVHGEIEVYKVVTGDKWKENSYLLIDREEKIRFIVDPGHEFNEVAFKDVDDNYVNLGILLTHAHHDHLSGADELSRNLGIPCILNSQDKRLWMHVNTYSLRFTGNSVNRPEKITWINDHIVTELRARGIRIINTPGHTTGSCCYLYKDIIFTGDTLLWKMIGRTDLPGSDKKMLVSSIDEIFLSCDDNAIIYSGHGKPWNIKEARAWWIENRNSAKEHNLFLNE